MTRGDARATRSALALSRDQIVAFRRRTSGLNERVPLTAAGLRRAAWAGLQDSMPRAALLSLHARVDGVAPSSWADRTLVQLWGPRFNVYVVARRDHAIFSLGRLPDGARERARAEQMAELLRERLGGRPVSFHEAGRMAGVDHNRLRYAAATGAVLLRWEGARSPVVWTVPPPVIDPVVARRELARRYLHVFGPATVHGFAVWAGISRPEAARAFASLAPELVPVVTPLGEAWLLARDEPAMRGPGGPLAPARLLPSGDAFFLLHGSERELLVPDETRRRMLWTPRVWPGALLVDGEVRGVWRRAGAVVSIASWGRLTATQQTAVEHEARSLPLPDLTSDIAVRWSFD